MMTNLYTREGADDHARGGRAPREIRTSSNIQNESSAACGRSLHHLKGFTIRMDPMTRPSCRSYVNRRFAPPASAEAMIRLS